MSDDKKTKPDTPSDPKRTPPRTADVEPAGNADPQDTGGNQPEQVPPVDPGATTQGPL